MRARSKKVKREIEAFTCGDFESVLLGKPSHGEKRSASPMYGKRRLFRWILGF